MHHAEDAMEMARCCEVAGLEEHTPYLVYCMSFSYIADFRWHEARAGACIGAGAAADHL